MAITNGYATLAELRARMNIPTADTGSDTIYEATIEAASRAIDGFCGRRFYQLATTTRYFTADDSAYLEIDDLVSISSNGLTTDSDGDRTYEDTWATTDYDLMPFNASDISWPYTYIETTPAGLLSFPTTRKGIKIAGTWGWPAVPDAVNEACLLQAARYAKRPAAPFGFDLGGADQGAALRIPQIDPDVKGLLAPYRRITIGSM